MCRWTSAKDKSLQVHRVQKGRKYTKVHIDICKGETSQGTLGTEGTRVHQVTDGHLQWTKVEGTLCIEGTRVHQGTDGHL